MCKNKYTISEDGTYAIVEITQGQVTLVDIDDLDFVKKHKLYASWAACNSSYYVRYAEYINKKTVIFQLHRTLINAEKGEVVDHINGDPLDNRKSNLRRCTKSQNAINHKLYKSNSSGQTGVAKTGDKWKAFVSDKGTIIVLGHFENIDDAIFARKKAEKELYGEYMRNTYEQNHMRVITKGRDYLPEKYFMEGYGEVYRVPLTKNKYAIIDIEDYDIVSQHKWYASFASHALYYASTNIRVDNKKTIMVMHRFIMGARHGQVIDHINGNSLDNRRCNLRECAQSDNVKNTRIPTTNKSGLKGAHWDKRSRKWIARIAVDGKQIHLGTFSTPQEAHEAYCAAALKYHGAFANFG